MITKQTSPSVPTKKDLNTIICSLHIQQCLWYKHLYLIQVAIHIQIVQNILYTVPIFSSSTYDFSFFWASSTIISMIRLTAAFISLGRPLSVTAFSVEPGFSRRWMSTLAFVSSVILRIVSPPLPIMAPTASLGTSNLNQIQKHTSFIFREIHVLFGLTWLPCNTSKEELP